MQQDIVAPDADDQSDHAAADREQQTSAKYWAHDPPARGAERKPDCDFLRAGGAAGEQHVGQIQAGDDQDRPGHAHEQRPDERDGAVVHWRRAHAEPRRLLDLYFTRALSVGRLNSRKTLSHHRQARLGHLDFEPGLQTRGDIELVIFRLRQIVQSLGIAKHRTKLRVNAEWQPDIWRDHRAHAAESVWRDADHRVGLPVDLKLAPDKILSSTHPFPERVARYNHWYVRVRPAFLCIIKTAADRAHAHEREKIFRRQERETPPHILILTDPRDREFQRSNISKNITAILAQLAILGVRELTIIVARILAHGENVHHLVRSQRNRRTQHHAIDQRENG